MIGIYARVVLAAMMLLATVGSGSSQEADATADFSNGLRPSSALKRIDSGTFELRQGQAIDLTDRKVLFAVRSAQDPNPSPSRIFTVAINGFDRNVRPGERIDLKDVLQSVFADSTFCGVDVLDYVAPKGAPATAKFRLICK